MGTGSVGQARRHPRSDAARWRPACVASAALMTLALTLPARAASSPEAPVASTAGNASKGDTGLTITAWTVDSGGGTASGGQFTATVTIGQAEADSILVAAGGSFSFTGGFWGMASPARGAFIFSSGFEASGAAATD